MSNPSEVIPKHLEPTPYTSHSSSSHQSPVPATATQNTSYGSKPVSTSSSSAGLQANTGKVSSAADHGIITGDSNGSNSKSDVTFQLIDENKHYNPHALEYFRKISIDNCGLNYHIVSVFGSQSTGKSTLLNALFGTRFDVMNETQRQQTTKGIWMAMAKKDSPGIFSQSKTTSKSSSSEPNLLIMDVEGTDGRERGEDQDFERKSALFALATSEVLIVNMWENQVGLYQGANMGLLKTVFEVNLSLFHTSSKTNRSKILFVIRDHIGTTPLENLRQTVLTDLMRIWESLSKPAAAAQSKLDDFFDVDFYALPHKVLMNEKFNQETATLSQHFTQTESPNYLFRREYHKGVPLDGWPMYSEQIWEQIEQNKDLDLPTQQTLVARFRCEEIANQAWQEFEAGLSSAQETAPGIGSGSEVVPTFGAIISKLRGTTLELYDSLASRYAQAVYVAKREELENRVDTRLGNLYKAQLTALSKKAIADFRDALKQKQSKKFIDVLQENHKKAIGYFTTNAKESSADVFKYDNELKALEKELLVVEDKAKANEIKRISVQANKKIVKEFDELETYFVEPEADTWDKVLVFFNNSVLFAISSVTSSGAEGLDFGVGGTKEENEAGALAIRKNAWIALDKELSQITKDDNVLFRLRERFEELFKYDDSGVPIVWKAGDDIETKYVASREKALEMIPIFATARLKNGELLKPDVEPLNIGRNGHGHDDDDDDANDHYDFDSFPFRLSKTKEQEITKRFKKQADASFVDAKRSTTQLAKAIPWYMFLITILLGWNEFMAVLRNPFLFMLLLLAGAGTYVAYSLNLWGPIISVTNAVVDRTMEVSKERLRDLLDEGRKVANSGNSSSSGSDASSNGGSRPIYRRKVEDEGIELKEM